MKKIIRMIMALSGFSVATAAGNEKPNVVFIHLDDLDFNEISCYRGSGLVLSPHMDQLAKDGMKFLRGYVTSPVCVPSRYAFLTGKYAGKNNRLAQEIPADKPVSLENVELQGKSGVFIEAGGGEKTIAHYFNELGYATAMVGKYHNDRISLQRPYLNFGSDARDPAALKKLKEHYAETVARVKAQTGFDVVDRLYWENKEAFPIEEIQFDNSPWVTEGAIHFIRANSKQPFFLYYASPLPHGIASSDGMQVNLRKRDPRATPAGFLENVPDVQPPLDDVFARVSAAGIKNENAAIITWLDDSVGALLRTLEEEGIAERTIVVLLSDHQSAGKRMLYEAGVNVPMIVKWPGVVSAGTVCGRLAASIDWLPTLVEAVGGIVNPGAVDGVSLLPLLKGSSSPVRESIFLEFGFAKGVVTEKWKYIALRYPPELQPLLEADKVIWDGSTRGSPQWFRRKFPAYSDCDQLFNLNDDPAEQKNLAADPAFVPVLQEMQTLLKQYAAGLPHVFGEFKTGK
ncbi:MAG: sulfatase-like hydrolase/transferase [Kiritimatiellales bacterium]